MDPQQNGASPARVAIEALAPRHVAGGADQLLGDVRVAALLAREARDRAMRRLFGVSKDQAGLANLIALLVAAQATYGAGKRLFGPDGPPTTADGMLLGATARELVYRAAGLPADGPPLLGTLLVAACGVIATRRIATRSQRSIRASSSRANVRFHHRYGYLVDVGHWREHRATRRLSGVQTPAGDTRTATEPSGAAESPAATAVSHVTTGGVSSDY